MGTTCAGWFRAPAAVVGLAVLVLGGAGPATGPAGAGSAAGPAVAGPAPSARADAAARPGSSSRADVAGGAREAVEILRDFRELAEAVRHDNERIPARGPAEVLAALGRPARTVEPPTLTPDRIDALLAEVRGDSGAATAPAATDAEFLRRAHLDLIGTPPTPEQIRRFVDDPDPAKRSALVDRLLADPGFGAHWARYWRDVIAYRATNQLFQRAGPAVLGGLEGWLADRFNANTPWDAIARDLITATGDSREAGPVLFHLAHADQTRIVPAEVAGEVSRIFLGVSIACAECHDHKTDPWTRRQFHEFAALFAGTRARPNGQPVLREGFTVADVPGRVRYTMPDLEDPERSIPVEPAFFLADPAAGVAAIPADLDAAGRRLAAAALVTGQDNPWFARAFVNRVWYELIGTAFVAPVDDLGPTRTAEDPELFEALADQFARGGYDIKWLYRTILNTRAYARAAGGSGDAGAEVAGRLGADQIFSSLFAALELDESAAARRGGRPGAPGAGVGAAYGLRFGPRALFHVVFGVDPSTPHEEVLGTIPQALVLMNGPQLHNAMRAAPGTMLGRLLRAHGDDGAAIEALYLRVLARAPYPDEMAVARAYLARVGDRREAFEDLLWCLVNSTEFLSRK